MSLERDINKFFVKSSHLNEASLNKVREDILDCVSSLHLSLRVAVWGDTSQNKLCIYGGLPFSLKGERDYSVPVQIWLSNQYPLEPPTIYVVPTEKEVIVTNHRFVDATGLCYTPSLSLWSPAKSVLKECILQIIKLFCLQPPLWIDDTKPAASTTSPSTPPREMTGDEDDSTCVVCLTNEKNTVLVPCGHYCCCQGCASNMAMCPVCRTTIQFRQKVFL